MLLTVVVDDPVTISETNSLFAGSRGLGQGTEKVISYETNTVPIDPESEFPETDSRKEPMS